MQYLPETWLGNTYNVSCFPTFGKNGYETMFLPVCPLSGNMARKQCFLVYPWLGNMARKQCFLFCPPSGNMARKQCFLVYPWLGNMARKQCFLFCPPSGNMGRKQCFLVFQDSTFKKISVTTKLSSHLSG